MLVLLGFRTGQTQTTAGSHLAQAVETPTQFEFLFNRLVWIKIWQLGMDVLVHVVCVALKYVL